MSFTPDNFDYGVAGADTIKNIVIFDGSPRGSEHSKTQFLAENFQRGAESAGAQVDYVKLNSLEIKPCCGCYACWAKTPGKCVYDDDVSEMIKKYVEADLIVFASPLYVFSVTGIMKNFLDRLLVPTFLPYLEQNELGLIAHPSRYDNKSKQYFAVLSASGFPDIDGNFDGLLDIFRCCAKHSGKISLMGEMLLPAAELISHPMLSQKKSEIAELCYKMGRDAVENGEIDKADMGLLAQPFISREDFINGANAFWKSLEGKSS